MLETQQSEKEAVLLTIQEALEILYSNKISRQTFMNQIYKEQWPLVHVMSRLFLPNAFVKKKIAEYSGVSTVAGE